MSEQGCDQEIQSTTIIPSTALGLTARQGSAVCWVSVAAGNVKRNIGSDLKHEHQTLFLEMFPNTDHQSQEEAAQENG